MAAKLPVVVVEGEKPAEEDDGGGLKIRTPPKLDPRIERGLKELDQAKQDAEAEYVRKREIISDQQIKLITEAPLPSPAVTASPPSTSSGPSPGDTPPAAMVTARLIGPAVTGAASSPLADAPLRPFEDLEVVELKGQWKASRLVGGSASVTPEIMRQVAINYQKESDRLLSSLVLTALEDEASKLAKEAAEHRARKLTLTKQLEDDRAEVTTNINNFLAAVDRLKQTASPEGAAALASIPKSFSVDRASFNSALASLVSQITAALGALKSPGNKSTPPPLPPGPPPSPPGGGSAPPNGDAGGGEPPGGKRTRPGDADATAPLKPPAPPVGGKGATDMVDAPAAKRSGGETPQGAEPGTKEPKRPSPEQQQLEEQVSKLRKEFDQFKATSINRVTQLSNQLDAANSALATSNARSEELVRQLASARETLEKQSNEASANLSKVVRERDEIAAALRRASENTSKQAEESLKEREGLTTENEQLQVQLTSERASALRLQSQLEAASTENKRLVSTVETVRKEYAELEARNLELRNRNEELGRQAATLSKENEALSKEKAEKAAEQLSNLSESNRLLEESKKQLEACNRAVAESGESAAKASATIQQLNNQLSEVKGALTALRSQYNDTVSFTERDFTTVPEKPRDTIRKNVKRRLELLNDSIRTLSIVLGLEKAPSGKEEKPAPPKRKGDGSTSSSGEESGASTPTRKGRATPRPEGSIPAPPEAPAPKGALQNPPSSPAPKNLPEPTPEKKRKEGESTDDDNGNEPVRKAATTEENAPRQSMFSAQVAEQEPGEDDSPTVGSQAEKK